ncbi:GNAT family N-acetyltransferase [Halodurantibacterium flavum]|uniref:GNAT family N-acetyltransferase n=1 Tax=Halodurantibacterium flavum TaxID=1382802 RepID=A0ABW4S2M8_9RHOB
MTILTTERLVLRQPAAADLEPFIAYLGSDRMTWLGGPMDRAEAWKMVAAVMGHWTIHGFGLFMLETREGRLLGTVGPQFPEGWPEPELAWHIFSASDEGKGYAAEAALAARRHAFDALGWPTAVSYIHQDNARSAALARRLGAIADPKAPAFAPGFVTWRHLNDGGPA